MYLTKENICDLNEIILTLNTIQNEKDKEEFLSKNVEDVNLFLTTLRKINKNKLPKNHKKNIKNDVNFTKNTFGNENEIIKIFKEKNDKTIMQEYSLKELRQMYNFVYKRKCSSNYTKERIISIFRDRIHTMNRVEAFVKMAKDRELNENKKE